MVTEGRLLAYHDISDGGLFATLCEMAFASRCGLEIALDVAPGDPLAVIFAEEPGAVLQVHADNRAAVVARLAAAGLAVHAIGAPATHDRIRIALRDHVLLDETRVDLHRALRFTGLTLRFTGCW